MIAQDHHRALIEAIEGREAARAESLAREHARVAQRNLEIVLANREVLERIPGASLIRLAEHTDDGAPESIDAATTQGSPRKSRTSKS